MAYDYREIVDAIPISSIQLVTTVRRTYTVIVTPDDAQKRLENNENNRKLNLNTVGRYASMMKQGQWDWVDGDMPLKFGPNGELMNGQHRLSAQVKANVVGVYDIRTGIQHESFKVMDSGVARKVADYFGATTGAKEVSALARKIIATNRGFKTKSSHSIYTYGKAGNAKINFTERSLSAPTRVDVINFAQENFDELLKYVQLASKIYGQNKKGGASNYAFALYLLDKCGHTVEDFVSAYVTGENGCDATKNTILKKLVNKDFSPKPEWYTSVTMIAYDKWVNGESMKVIRKPDVESRYKAAIEEYRLTLGIMQEVAQ